MSAITDEIHTLIAELEAEGHVLADRFRAAWTALKGDEQQLATEARQDATQLTAAVRPVMQEAQADAEHLAAEAATDIKDAIHPALAPAQPEPPTAA